jgi:DNA-binding SARP family transcriptional activator
MTKDSQNGQMLNHFPIMICLLGSFKVLVSGQPVPLRKARKSEGLLSALSLRPQSPIPRESLLDTLWPCTEHSLASQSLNSLIHSLRKLFKPWLQDAALILYENGSYRLNLDAGVSVDIAIFENLVTIGESEKVRGNTDASFLAFNRAIQVYHGDLSVGTDVQAIVERERLRAIYLTLLSHLADEHYQNGDYRTCLNLAHQLLARDPCREDAYRMLMRCYVKVGERTQALRQYRICKEVLNSEFGAVPEQATRSLYDQVRVNPELI